MPKASNQGEEPFLINVNILVKLNFLKSIISCNNYYNNFNES